MYARRTPVDVTEAILSGPDPDMALTTVIPFFSNPYAAAMELAPPSEYLHDVVANITKLFNAREIGRKC